MGHKTIYLILGGAALLWYLNRQSTAANNATTTTGALTNIGTGFGDIASAIDSSLYGING
ncbi:MAG TPA: hypothetical protein VNE82_03555 [Candidatus Binataceae bacterium]|nr:hypothetical protein [Candidatus Binataceae bacterium]